MDNLLPFMADDPRIQAGKTEKEPPKKIVKQKGGGRNTESFNPASTLVRPEMRVVVGPNREVLGKPVKHDDVLIVPEFFCAEDDWSIYYELVKEMREAQAEGDKRSEWISWHEGAHLISQNPTGSKKFQEIKDKIAKYFEMKQETMGTRFNWYRDASDWKVRSFIYTQFSFTGNTGTDSM